MAKYLLLKHYRGAPAPVDADVSMDRLDGPGASDTGTNLHHISEWLEKLADK